MIKQIHTENAPKAVGPYSQATAIGDFIYCSGQIGIDPKTGKLKKGIEEQTKQALKNLKAVLEAAGADVATVMKTTIYITDMDNYKKVNELYAEVFVNHKPARATVGVSALPAGAEVEIEAFAIRAFEPMQACDCEGECEHDGKEGCCGGGCC